MDENKKIGYRPDLKYTDEYTSDIQYHRDNQDDSNNNQDDINNLIDDLLEQGQDLQNLVDKLPDFIGDIIKDHLDPIIDFVEDELKDKKLEKVPTLLEWTYKPYEPDPKPKPDDNDDNKPVDDPEYDIWNPTDDIVIEKKRYEYSEIIQKEYIKNIYDLMSEYYSELQNILSNFWSILLYSIMNKESNEIKVILDNIILNSSEVNGDKRHLVDLSVKSEINRDMKLKYLALIPVSKKIYSGKTYFKYHNLKLYKLKSFDKFLELIEDGTISVNMKISFYTSKEKYGKIQDKGTTFEIAEKDLEKLFTRIDISNI